MNNQLMIKKNDWETHFIIEHPIRFVRKGDSKIVSYTAILIKNSKTEDLSIVVSSDSRWLLPTNWNETDIVLFKYYLEDEHKQLPIYADIYSTNELYYFVSE